MTHGCWYNRNEELLAQVSHMKDEIVALQKSEEDMIEYQRSLEASTRLVQWDAWYLLLMGKSSEDIQ